MKLVTSRVPKCPFVVAVGPDQTPLVCGLPDNKSKRFIAGCDEIVLSQKPIAPLLPALLGWFIVTVT